MNTRDHTKQELSDGGHVRAPGRNTQQRMAVCVCVCLFHYSAQRVCVGSQRPPSITHPQIKAVGFDMDYTLAQYFTAFDQLAFDGAKAKLLQDLGYPEEVDAFDYDPEHFSRGLVIDLERGESWGRAKLSVSSQDPKPPTRNGRSLYPVMIRVPLNTSSGATCRCCKHVEF